MYISGLAPTMALPIISGLVASLPKPTRIITGDNAHFQGKDIQGYTVMQKKSIENMYKDS